MKNGEKEEKPNSNNTHDSSQKEDDQCIGFDLYPERRKRGEKSWYKTLSGIQGREDTQRKKCEVNVYKCFQRSSMVKLLLGALKSSGCPVDIRRHISCEICTDAVTGGYDAELNQIIICQNQARSMLKVQGVLIHELIHMFDYCRHKFDLASLDHLACTEIRAANIGHCSFLGSWLNGFASPFNIKQTHQVCVKDKAVRSVMAARRVSKEVAEEVVEKVFGKCYNDLEPVGRRLRRNSLDMEKAYNEGYLYGYKL